jgi:glucose/arabinose dehydrogenase
LSLAFSEEVGLKGGSHNRLSEFRVSSDPNRVDADSERVIMEVDWPFANHNGGQIRFGPDGYLYVPMGDGGGANDVGRGHNPDIGNGQDIASYLGKMHRIYVDNTDNKPYGIPKDNPFLGNGNESGLPEIYAYGLRNAAYASFDPKSGLLFVGNAGQELFESIYVIVKGGNYGWNIREGTQCFDPDNSRQPPDECRTTGYRGEPLIGPVVEVGHDVGDVIIGGYVYRGNAMPGFWTVSSGTGSDRCRIGIRLSWLPNCHRIGAGKCLQLLTFDTGDEDVTINKINVVRGN